MAITQFTCNGPVDQCPTISVTSGSTSTIQTVQSYASTFVNADFDTYWTQIGWLVLTVAIVEFVSMSTLTYVRHLKR